MARGLAAHPSVTAPSLAVPGYTLPNDTVKNKLGATSHKELEKREAEPVRHALVEIELGLGPQGQFDADHLKAIHRHLFQKVYEWAGHTRDERIALSDGEIATEPFLKKPDGQLFLIGPAIPAALDNLSTTLRETDYLRGLPREQFAERAADLMAELNAVHPFREGNGRTQRVFMEQLAHAAGHDLDFTVVSKERMAQASIAANEQGDFSMMRRMFNEISDPARVAALENAIESLAKHGFPWNDRYIATTEPGHSVEVTMVSIAGEHFMARTESQILIGNTSDLPNPGPGKGQTFTLTAAERTAARGSTIEEQEPSLAPDLDNDGGISF
jgi:cell filamentation protein